MKGVGKLLNFSFYVPTQIIHGQEVIVRNADQFKKFGKKALIVTGKHSAKICGALADVETALMQTRIKYQVYDQVENNPSVANIDDAVTVVSSFNPDFIIGIGGGSPLDAAKTIAILAVNDVDARQILKTNLKNKPLPIIAIPTTAGSGSEVTPYAVLTVPEKQTKKSFSDLSIFPKLAFLDYRYTESLETETTRDTAVDALAHLIEAYLSRKANDASDLLVEAGLKLWSRCISDLKTEAFSQGMRDNLLVASALGGMAIAHTGTTVGHALGYPLTYFHDIPHGRATGWILAEYLRYNFSHAKSRVEKVLKILYMQELTDFSHLLHQLVPRTMKLTEEQISDYGIAASRTKNATHSLGDVTSQICMDILRSSLG